MKILAFTDVHSDQKTIKSLLERAKKVDILICCGDFTFFGQDYKKIIKQFASCKKPVFIIHGNHEEGNDLNELNKYENIHFVHKKIMKIKDNLYIFGFGGGGFSFTEDELEELIPKVKKNLKKKEKLILITHAPPYKTELDIVPPFGHRGCMSIRKFITEIQPIIALSGHIHEGFGLSEKIKNTIAISPGDEGKIIEIK